MTAFIGSIKEFANFAAGGGKIRRSVFFRTTSHSTLLLATALFFVPLDLCANIIFRRNMRIIGLTPFSVISIYWQKWK
jgi:hypothetical protein